MDQPTDLVRSHGSVAWVLWTPDGTPIERGQDRNIITAYGHRMYGERGAGVPNYPNPPTGMRLGTGTTAPTYTGAGSMLDTYVSGSARVLSAIPTSSMPGALRRIIYTCSWPVGVATTTLREVVLTNEFPLTDIPGIDANTIARAVFATPIVKTANSGLTVVWTHDLE